MAKHETSRVIEKCVAQANPKEAVIESVKYKNAERLEFKIGVSEEWIEILAKVKDLLSQKNSKAVSSEDALMYVMQEFIEKHDPVKKAERAEMRLTNKLAKSGARLDSTHLSDSKDVQQFPRTVELKTAKINQGRKRLKRVTMHGVHLRDQNRCTIITPTG